MNNSRLRIKWAGLVMLLAGLGLLTFYKIAPTYAFNLWENSRLYQTIPTMTPVPPPTATPGSDPVDPPPPPPPPQATDTPLPPSPTATAAATRTPLPPGSYLPTAMPCGEPPTAQALNAINVRRGPGVNYPILASLAVNEVRPITGRAAMTAWWQIELNDNRLGWVRDDLVSVQGYTGNVPIATPPPINGNTPTPAAGPAWNPTPNPICTPTPTATATATAPPTVTNTRIIEMAEKPAETEPAEEAVVVAAEADTEADTAVDAAETIPTNTPPAGPSQPVSASPEGAPIAGPTPAPAAEEEEAVSGSTMVLFTGLGLILAGAAYIVIARRKEETS